MVLSNLMNMNNDLFNYHIRNKYNGLYTHKGVRKWIDEDGYGYINLDADFMMESSDHFLKYLEWNGVIYNIKKNIKLTNEECMLLYNHIQKYYPS